MGTPVCLPPVRGLTASSSKTVILSSCHYVHVFRLSFVFQLVSLFGLFGLSRHEYAAIWTHMSHVSVKHHVIFLKHAPLDTHRKSKNRPVQATGRVKFSSGLRPKPRRGFPPRTPAGALPQTPLGLRPRPQPGRTPLSGLKASAHLLCSVLYDYVSQVPRPKLCLSILGNRASAVRRSYSYGTNPLPINTFLGLFFWEDTIIVNIAQI